MKYYFLMIDGPDGAGKGVVLEEIIKNLKGTKFNLINYWKENDGCYPESIESIDADIIISAEPTYSKHGIVIRNLIKKADEYPAAIIAQMYSDDRFILYKEIIIPALKRGIKIIQDRGISSSLVYQPLDAKLKKEDLSIQKILNLKGNTIAMQYPPSHLLIVYTNVETLFERLSKRKKKDNCSFENLEFQKELIDAYRSKEFSGIFEKVGTKVIYLENSSDIETLKSKITELMNNELAPKETV